MDGRTRKRLEFKLDKVEKQYSHVIDALSCKAEKDREAAKTLLANLGKEIQELREQLRKAS